MSWSSSDAANLYDIEFATSELEPAYMSITAPNTTITWATSPGETSPNWVTVRAHSAAAGKEQMIIGWSTFARRVNCMNTELHTSSQTRQLLPPPRRVGGLQHDSISIHWTPSPTTHGRGMGKVINNYISVRMDALPPISVPRQHCARRFCTHPYTVWTRAHVEVARQPCVSSFLGKRTTHPHSMVYTIIEAQLQTDAGYHRFVGSNMCCNLSRVSRVAGCQEQLGLRGPHRLQCN